jgi:hypothetical protein
MDMVRSKQGKWAPKLIVKSKVDDSTDITLTMDRKFSEFPGLPPSWKQGRQPHSVFLTSTA